MSSGRGDRAVSPKLTGHAATWLSTTTGVAKYVFAGSTPKYHDQQMAHGLRPRGEEVDTRPVR